VRLLEHRRLAPTTLQLLVSTKPEVSPAGLIRSIKGRWQYLLRQEIPQLWRRHYHITSVGEANCQTLQAYVAKQVQHHPMADARATERLQSYQFLDEQIELSNDRASGHGRFVFGLQIVIETAQHLPDIRSQWLDNTRSMIIKTCRHKGWLLYRIGIASNHFHILVGGNILDSPSAIALSLMNNLAFAHDMRPVFEPNFYLGTFGCYDRGAIRRHL
jgi:REP element-mobilizing transposase RayT